MNNTDDKSNKLRRQKINLMLNEEERRIIIEKAIKYGYGDCLAEYMRAASIYENIYVENVEGKTEICEMVSSFIEILKEILQEQRKLLHNHLLSPDDINSIKKQNDQIIRMIDSLSNTIVSILSVNTETQIQKRKTALDNHQFSLNKINKILEKEKAILILRPSNLHLPNQKSNYVVFLPEYMYIYELDKMDEENTISFYRLVNQFRDVAMQKRLLLAFLKEDNLLKVGIVGGFIDLNVASNFAEDIKSSLISLEDYTKEKEGDIYTNNC